MKPADLAAAAATVWGLFLWLLTQIASVGLLLLIACAVAGKFGIRLPMVPQVDATALAWLCGAWWLYRGGKI